MDKELETPAHSIQAVQFTFQATWGRRSCEDISYEENRQEK